MSALAAAERDRMELSYTQNLEDYHLSLAFAGQPTGTYIDVGGGHQSSEDTRGRILGMTVPGGGNGKRVVRTCGRGGGGGQRGRRPESARDRYLRPHRDRDAVVAENGPRDAHRQV